ncbi:hypothetical protein [Streptomyces sp. RB13]|uniref:hypothetical protein n=1 Tax=Streptomyces sp. RB13 TaxID=2950978 RepID=UPI002FC5B62F
MSRASDSFLRASIAVPVRFRTSATASARAPEASETFFFCSATSSTAACCSGSVTGVIRRSSGVDEVVARSGAGALESCAVPAARWIAEATARFPAAACNEASGGDCRACGRAGAGAAPPGRCLCVWFKRSDTDGPLLTRRHRPLFAGQRPGAAGRGAPKRGLIAR